MEKEQLKEFVQDFVNGQIFTSAHIDFEKGDKWWADTVSRVFLPVLLGCLAEATPLEMEDLGIIWAYEREALRRGINGYPCFMKCRLMHKDDWEQVNQWINKIQNLTEKVFEG